LKRSDEIPVEAIRADTDTAVYILYNLSKKIWEGENIPKSGKRVSSLRCQRREN
jgi:hypothetical protein